jgi:hypothetical protein
MKKLFNTNAKRMLALLLFSTSNLFVFAQEKVNINGHDVGTWFKYNWMWVAGAVILLLIILSFTGSSRRKTTTIVKDNYGDTKRIITTEEVD